MAPFYLSTPRRSSCSTFLAPLLQMPPSDEVFTTTRSKASCNRYQLWEIHIGTRVRAPVGFSYNTQSRKSCFMSEMKSIERNNNTRETSEEKSAAAEANTAPGDARMRHTQYKHQTVSLKASTHGPQKRIKNHTGGLIDALSPCSLPPLQGLILGTTMA